MDTLIIRIEDFKWVSRVDLTTQVISRKDLFRTSEEDFLNNIILWCLVLFKANSSRFLILSSTLCSLSKLLLQYKILFIMDRTTQDLLLCLFLKHHLSLLSLPACLLTRQRLLILLLTTSMSQLNYFKVKNSRMHLLRKGKTSLVICFMTTYLRYLVNKELPRLLECLLIWEILGWWKFAPLTTHSLAKLKKLSTWFLQLNLTNFLLTQMVIPLLLLLPLNLEVISELY